VKQSTASIALNAALTVAALVTLAPLAWMVSASFMTTGVAGSYPPPFFPTSPTFSHYLELITRLHLGRSFLNSLIVATVITVLSLVTNSMAGYAFAKLRFRGRDRLFRGLLAALVIPVQVSLLPLFLLLKQMGLVNTYWAVILPAAASAYGVFLVRQYALSIPGELLDAARVDGAGELRIFFTMVLPWIRPVLAALGIFTFLTAWNDFLWPLIVLTDNDMYTLPVAIAILSGEHVQDTELMMASSVVTVLPVLVVFVVLQRHLIGGIMMGSLKG
jgi:multiple sugar transport system permease protein